MKTSETPALTRGTTRNAGRAGPSAPALAALTLAAWAVGPRVADAQPAKSVAPPYRTAMARLNVAAAYHALYAPSGPANTPYGPMYNVTQSPEWKAGGNNWPGFLAVVARRQAAVEAKELARQMAEAERWLIDQEQRRSQGRPLDPRYEALLKEQERYNTTVAASRSRPRKPAARPKPAASAAPARPARTSPETRLAMARALAACNPTAASEHCRAVLDQAPDTELAASARSILARLGAGRSRLGP